SLLLLLYCLCLIGMLLFRAIFAATSQLHHEKRFILDLTVSMTLLTFLIKLFLLIFAFLEALTIQHSLPLTKKKFIFLRSKLVKDNKNNFIKTSQKNSKSVKPLPPDNIYITPNSIYGSGRHRNSV